MPDDRTWNDPAGAVVRFGSCEVHVATREVLVRAMPVHLEPKAFDLLMYLIEHRERVVTKNELLERIWGTVCVSESALAQMVMKVRRAIGAEEDGSEWIRTAQRVGYRFVGSVADPAGALAGGKGLAWRREAPRTPPGDPVEAHRAYLRALQAARQGRAHLALALCLECGDLDPGSLEVLIEHVRTTRGEDSEGRICLRWVTTDARR